MREKVGEDLQRAPFTENRLVTAVACAKDKRGPTCGGGDRCIRHAEQQGTTVHLQTVQKVFLGCFRYNGRRCLHVVSVELVSSSVTGMSRSRTRAPRVVKVV